MRILLRHTGSGQYLQTATRWTSEVERAYDFHFIDRALEYAARWELQEVELAFAFEDATPIRTAALQRTALHYAAA